MEPIRIYGFHPSWRHVLLAMIGVRTVRGAVTLIGLLLVGTLVMLAVTTTAISLYQTFNR
jgi:hypothetical protein